MRGPQRRCFYASSPTGQLMAVDITTQPTFQQGTPRVVLEEGFRLVAGTQGANDDVSLDGQPNIKPDEGLVARGESPASHRDERGAPRTRRDDRKYGLYLKEEQRRPRGCVARRMQTDFHHGLLVGVTLKPRRPGLPLR